MKARAFVRSSSSNERDSAMGDWKLPWTGAGLCGQVKVQVAQAPVFAAACHCRACQKLTGGAY
ncbi:GFA family protein, partial [Klebsiella variicola]|uniref:GFA family protein n=1 Tax=Klebsiella variicola TaxID=244366 RepID=UPI003F746EBD